MQAELTQAEADLDFAELAVTAGTAAVGRQRDSVAALISDIYTQGDPDLLAFSSLLDAQTPADLLRSAEGQRVIVGTQTRMYDDLTAAELLLKVREGEVSTAKDTVADKAKAATEHVEVVRGLEADAETAKNDVVQLGRRAQGRQAGVARRPSSTTASSCGRRRRRTPGSSTCSPSGPARRGCARCARRAATPDRRRAPAGS